MSLTIGQSQKKLLALQREGENKLCFECKAVNPQWASPKYGIFICLECAGTHRSLGVHISFVRSITMDQFKPDELKLMEIGGNERARLFFEENGIDTSVPIKVKYNSTVAEDYREKLAAEIKGEEWTRRDRPVHIPHETEPEIAPIDSNAAVKQFQKPNTAPAQSQDPTLNDLAADAFGAISTGWGWFSQAVSQTVTDTTTNYIRPGMRQFADSDISGNARKAMAQFGRRAKEAGAYGAEQFNHAIENFGAEGPQEESEYAGLFDGWRPRTHTEGTESPTSTPPASAAATSGGLAETEQIGKSRDASPVMDKPAAAVSSKKDD